MGSRTKQKISWLVNMEQNLQIETFGEVYPKFMIELVADGEPNGSFKLLLWDGVQSYIQRSVRLAPGPGSDSEIKVVFVAPEVDSTVRRATRFPTHDAPLRYMPRVIRRGLHSYQAIHRPFLPG